MSQISDPDVIRFCNEVVRPMADYAVTLANYSAGSQTQLANLVAAGLVSSADTIADGSPNDGRHPLTGAQVTTFLTNLNTIFTNAPLLALLRNVSVNNFQPNFSQLSWNIPVVEDLP